MGGRESSCLLIDESSFTKKGKESVAVARQWNGRLGKVDNCQVAVFASLAAEDKAALVDVRLYLPQEWVNDENRCLAAGIPRDHIVFKKKVELFISSS